VNEKVLFLDETEVVKLLEVCYFLVFYLSLVGYVAIKEQCFDDVVY